MALFGPLVLKPGESALDRQVPAAGEARVIIDLKTQLLYVYRDDAAGRRVDHLERQEGQARPSSASGRC